jgi:glucokinase
MDENLTTIGVDMGGTKIAVGPFRNGKLIEDEILKESTPQNGNSEEILETIANMANSIKNNFDARAIGVSTAGMVNSDGTMIGGCGNIKGWKGTAVRARLEELTGLPTIVENDANCAAFAEYKVGCAKDYDPILLVILGTGLGGGLVFNDKIWTGAHFGGGEIGHIKISDKKARRCTCGDWDCWEAYASGTGLQNTARLYFADPSMDNYRLMELFEKGDETAKEIIESWHDYIAMGMSSVINVIDPEAIVISGGMAQFVNYPKLNKKVKERVIDGLKDYVKILEGVMGNDSGMVGAACLALKRLSTN